ncbi:MAG: hypothetical protein JNK85_02090 [Verrucomicrobiales bacterium]|nr:hypothetical protein [Verrucomicrobiales bacterium]
MKRFGFAQTLLALVAVGGIASGCGGVRGSHSVSPATFFMPGLMHHEPAQPVPAQPAPVADPSGIESSPRLSGPADRALPS